MSIPRVSYACCKHGPRHNHAQCGFAHCLSDIGMPTDLRMRERLFRDQTRYSSGHPGIDLFVGQSYSPLQMERLLRYRERERERACFPCVGPHGYAFIDHFLGTVGPTPTLGGSLPCSHSFVINRL